MMDEKVLVQQLKRNEPGAFRTVVELYQDQVLNTCYRFLFNKDEVFAWHLFLSFFSFFWQWGNKKNILSTVDF